MADLASIELSRIDLERQVEKLRASLRHWRLWEAEYEGFKEEIESLADDAHPHELIRCGLEFGGEIVDEKEVKDLVQYTKPRRRSKKEVLAAITARAATGYQNATSLQKQLHATEGKLEQLNSIDVQDGAQEPVMEITELLDDDDNIISSNVVNANQQTDWLSNKLREAEAKPNLSKGIGNEGIASDNEEPGTGRTTETHLEEQIVRPFEEDATSDEPMTSSSANEVQAAQDSMPQVTVPIRPAQDEPTRGTVSRELLELDENDQIVGKRTLSIPTSTEDTIRHQREAMRNAAEIGPIVATMDIESDPDFSDMDEEYDNEEYWDDELDENEFGANAISNEFTPEYLAEMKALMDKYQPMIRNIGPDEDSGFPRANPINKLPTPMPKETRELAIASPAIGVSKKSTAKKGVRFADDLDIAAEGSPLSRIVETKAELPLVEDAATIIDVIERRPMNQAQPPQAPGMKPKRMSRFKASQLGLA